MSPEDSGSARTAGPTMGTGCARAPEAGSRLREHAVGGDEISPPRTEAAREGAHLAKDLVNRISLMREAVGQVKSNAPQVAERYRAALLERIKAMAQ